VLLAIGDTLTDGTNHVAGLADPNAHLAPFITNDNDGPEAHLFAALNGFGDASYLNDPLLPFGITLLAATAVPASALATTIAAAATAFALTAALAAAFLPFGTRHICGGRDVAGLNLFVGFGHGERRNQN
jgi:hypothetical protein